MDPAVNHSFRKTCTGVHREGADITFRVLPTRQLGTLEADCVPSDFLLSNLRTFRGRRCPHKWALPCCRPNRCLSWRGVFSVRSLGMSVEERASGIGNNNKTQQLAIPNTQTRCLTSEVDNIVCPGG